MTEQTFYRRQLYEKTRNTVANDYPEWRISNETCLWKNISDIRIVWLTGGKKPGRAESPVIGPIFSRFQLEGGRVLIATMRSALINYEKSVRAERFFAVAGY